MPPGDGRTGEGGWREPVPALKGRGPTARQVSVPEHPLFQRSPCFDLVELRRTEPNREGGKRVGAGPAEGGASSAILLCSPVICRRFPAGSVGEALAAATAAAHVVTCEGVRR